MEKAGWKYFIQLEMKMLATTLLTSREPHSVWYRHQQSFCWIWNAKAEGHGLHRWIEVLNQRATKALVLEALNFGVQHTL